MCVLFKMSLTSTLATHTPVIPALGKLRQKITNSSPAWLSTPQDPVSKQKQRERLCLISSRKNTASV